MTKHHIYQTYNDITQRTLVNGTVCKPWTKSPAHRVLQKVRFLIYKCNISQAFLWLMAVNPDSCALSGIIHRFLLW